MSSTALQVSHSGLIALLRQWEQQMSPREYATLIDVLARYLEVERARHTRSLRRWAA